MFLMLAASQVTRDAEGVKYFRDLLSSETLRLSALCRTWKETLTTETDAITDDGEVLFISCKINI